MMNKILSIILFVLFFQTHSFAEEPGFVKSVRLNDQAVAYVFRGDRQKAFDMFNQALDLNPKNPSALYNLAALYLAEDSPQRAKVSIEKALTLKPDDLSFLIRHVEILMITKEFNLAEKQLKKIIKIEPNYLAAKRKLAIACGMLKKWECAESNLQTVRKLAGDDKNLLSNLGNILLVREKFHKAIKVLERAQNFEADADNEVSLAIAYEAIGLKERALLSYKRARVLGNNDRATLAQIEHLSRSNQSLAANY